MYTTMMPVPDRWCLISLFGGNCTTPFSFAGPKSLVKKYELCIAKNINSNTNATDWQKIQQSGEKNKSFGLNTIIVIMASKDVCSGRLWVSNPKYTLLLNVNTSYTQQTVSKRIQMDTTIHYYWNPKVRIIQIV